MSNALDELTKTLDSIIETYEALNGFNEHFRNIQSRVTRAVRSPQKRGEILALVVTEMAQSMESLAASLGRQKPGDACALAASWTFYACALTDRTGEGTATGVQAIETLADLPKHIQDALHETAACRKLVQPLQNAPSVGPVAKRLLDAMSQCVENFEAAAYVANLTLKMIHDIAGAPSAGQPDADAEVAR